MFDLDLTTMTVDEVAEKLMDNFRITNEGINLEGCSPSVEGTKLLKALRKVAREDAVALADAFLALSLDAISMESEVALLRDVADLLLPVSDETRNELQTTDEAAGA